MKVKTNYIIARKEIRELLKVVGYNADEMGFDGIRGVTIKADAGERVEVEIRVFGREDSK